MLKGSTALKQYENILGMKYRAAQNKSQGKAKIVHLLSTKHNATMKNTATRYHEGNIIQKPEAIIYYNGSTVTQHQCSKKHRPKQCRVCYAKGKRKEAGHIIRSNFYCPDYPEKPGLYWRLFQNVPHQA